MICSAATEMPPTGGASDLPASLIDYANVFKYKDIANLPKV